SLLSSYCVYYFFYRRPPISSLFPYTTLFRSALSFFAAAKNVERAAAALAASVSSESALSSSEPIRIRIAARMAPRFSGATPCRRSEEHTSELQSRRDLVCRLLLEKKKNRSKR